MNTDLQDIITSTCIKAFNSGYAAGVVEGRDRMMKIFDEVSVSNEIGDYAYLSDVKDYLEEYDAKARR